MQDITLICKTRDRKKGRNTVTIHYVTEVTVFLPFFLSLVFLQTSAISCTRLKFDYEMAVYELYEYGDVHVMNCYSVISFLPDYRMPVI